MPGSANVIPQREQASAVPSSGTSDDAEHDGVIAACTEVLERYEATPGSSLVYAGYLDLFGNVWACLVAGPGWAELCVVRAGEGGMAQTSVARIDNSLLHDLGGDAL